MEEIVKIERSEYVSEYVSGYVSDHDNKTYEEASVTIKRLCGYGLTEFNPPLKVDITIEKGGETAYISYDFGMQDRISIKKDRNCLYNYSNDNQNADPVLTAVSTIKYDLEHAFHHYDGDPNYNHTHWALRAELQSRVTAYDWYELEDFSKETQLEFDFS